MAGNEWTKCTVRDIAAPIKNALVGGPFGSDLVSSDYVPEGVPVIRGQNLTPGPWVGGPFVYVSSAKAEQLSANLARPGDLVFTQRGNAVLNGGQVAIVPSGLHNEFVVSQSQMKLTVDAKRADARFLYYVFRSQRHSEYLRQNAVVTGVPHTNLGLLRDYEVALPPLREQQVIAHILGTLDDKIELNRRMNETLEGMARAIFKSWFVDFGPVRAKMEGRKPPGMDTATAKLFPDTFEDSELGPIPKGWAPIPLPDAFDFMEGPGLRNWQYTIDGMRFLNIRCIVDGDLDVHNATCISLEEFHEKYEHFSLQKDDVVISTSGTLGRSAIVREDHLPVMLNTSIIRMRGRVAYGMCFIWAYLQGNYFLDEMRAMASGSVQLNFGPMHLKRMVVLHPSSAVLERFEKVVEPLIRRVLLNRRESMELARVRDALLPRLLSGELRLRDAERTVGRSV